MDTFSFPSVKTRIFHLQLLLMLSVGLLFAFGLSTRTMASGSNGTAVLVQDDASLLSAEQISALTSDCENLSQSTGWDVMALTIADAEGYDTGDFTDLFFLEQNTQDDGVIGVIDMDNRQIYVYTSGEAIDYLTDSRIESILDDAYEYVSDGAYYEALQVMFEDIAEYYKNGVPNGAYRYDEETGEVTYYQPPNSLSQGELLIALAVGLIAAAGIFGSTAARYQMKLGGYKYDFRKGSSLNLSRRNDRFVNRFVTRRHIPRNPPPSSGGGGGRSTVHTGPSGHSHGGGGRSF